MASKQQYKVSSPFQGYLVMMSNLLIQGILTGKLIVDYYYFGIYKDDAIIDYLLYSRIAITLLGLLRQAIREVSIAIAFSSDFLGGLIYLNEMFYLLTYYILRNDYLLEPCQESTKSQDICQWNDQQFTLSYEAQNWIFLELLNFSLNLINIIIFLSLCCLIHPENLVTKKDTDATAQESIPTSNKTDFIMKVLDPLEHYLMSTQFIVLAIGCFLFDAMNNQGNSDEFRSLFQYLIAFFISLYIYLVFWTFELQSDILNKVKFSIVVISSALISIALVTLSYMRLNEESIKMWRYSVTWIKLMLPGILYLLPYITIMSILIKFVRPLLRHQTPPKSISVDTSTQEKLVLQNLEELEHSLENPQNSLENPQPSLEKTQPSLEKTQPSLGKAEPQLEEPKPSLEIQKQFSDKSTSTQKEQDDSYKLREDQYSICFYRYIRYERIHKEYVLKNDEATFIRDNKEEERYMTLDFINCLFIFTIQMVLAFFIYRFMSIGDDNDGGDQSSMQTQMIEITYEYQKLILRFACIIVLHIQIESEIYQAINLMNYSLYAKDITREKLPQIFLIALMQLTGAFATEILNLYYIFLQNKPVEIVLNLIAFGIIAEIDDLYASSRKDKDLKEAAYEEKYQIQEEIFVSKKSKIVQKLYAFVYKALKIIYQSAYYYFLPFIALIIFKIQVPHMIN